MRVAWIVEASYRGSPWYTVRFGYNRKTGRMQLNYLKTDAVPGNRYRLVKYVPADSRP